jgi:ribulose-bisphosphate carboxylase large chain
MIAMDDARIYATYRIETAHPPDQAAEIMAGEQSASTFVRVPGETPDLLARHGARVERVVPLDAAEAPALPGAKPPKGATQPVVHQRAEVEISWPFENVGPSLTALFTTVAGNLFELSPFSGLRLCDLRIPRAFGDAYPPPGFGVSGTRRLAGVENGPLIGTIIKPSVGLSPDATAELVGALCAAGIDFIKDDELQTDSPHNPLAARVAAVMRAVNDHAERTGKKVMVAFNLTGDLDAMLRGHDLVLAHGGTCVMVNMLSVGFAAVAHLRRNCALPIHGHRAGWGMLSRHPLLGMDYAAFQVFARLAGVDHLHVNGLRNKFCESDESVIASARAVLTPLWDDAPFAAMPVFSSGQTAAQAPDTYRALGTTDLLYLAGGGLMAHPGGIAAGVAALRQAWDAAQAGISLEAYARDHAELAEALGFYGRA